jgi:hypothetical protein
MKGLNKIALVVAIAAASTAQAELVAMDESAMSAATGQAGLTIDVNSALIQIGEIQYRDGRDANPLAGTAAENGGSIFITGFKMGGAGLVDAALGLPVGTVTHSNAVLDNLRINVDVAGDDAAALQGQYGLAKIGAGVSLAFTADAAGNGADAAYYDKTIVKDSTGADVWVNEITDGDLLIGLDAQDQTKIVDFGFVIGQVSLGGSTMKAGDTLTAASAPSADFRSTADGRTVLMANTALGGGIGPVDILIDGQDGGMNINAHFALKGQMEFPFVATKMGFELHNRRGMSLVGTGTAYDDGTVHDLTGAFANVTIGKTTNVAGNTALKFDINRFESDIDMTNIQLGDNGASIGELYITDLKMSAQTVIYGH